MTESEKAKAYDEALERAKSAIKNCGDNEGRIAMIESIFPALSQSEDERIRKRLIDFFEDWREYRSHCWGIAVTAILAWLEKQGESYTKKDVDDAYLKGICDAKHELGKQSEQKPVDKVEPFDKYEGLTDFERTLADICIGWIGEELGWKQYIKDSADVLLKIAIKKFNSIQDAPFEQKSAAWSDEDEKMYKIAFSCIETLEDMSNGKNMHANVKGWLKSLKNRVQPQIKKWSDEDEENLQHCCMAISADGLHTYEDKQEMEVWLKRLKDRIGG